MESIRANEEKPLYNSRLIDTYLKFIQKNYRNIDVNLLLNQAGMKLYQVEDEGHWFTQKQIDRFYEKLRKLTGNKELAREAGRHGASPETLGVMRQYIFGLIGPAKAYEMVGKYASNFTRSAVYESRRIGQREVEITVTPVEGVEERPFQCENRIGYFEAISTLFRYRLPKIEHPECLFKGNKSCRYIVSWKESHSSFWKKIRNYASLFLSAVLLVSVFISPGFTLTVLLPMSALLVMCLSLYSLSMENKELNNATDNLRETTEKLLRQINQNYDNTLMINEIGLALSKKTDINSILAEVVEVFQKWLDYDRGLVLLANKHKTSLEFRAGFGYNKNQVSILKNISFHLDRPESKGVFVVSFREKRPFLVNNLDEIKETLSPRSLEFALNLGTKSFICCPIIYEDEPIGILAVDNINTKRPLLQSDINLLMSITPTIGISVHNAMLFEEKEQQFKSILKVLAATIDARDPLTSGHSERVTEYAVGICSELGLPRETCEMIRVASLLHDYGKIGIKDSILKKEGLLDGEEREEIKTHAEKTKNILEQINFEGIYSEVPDIAGSHHEKFDGSGYPKGLKAEEIPLGARILAVADFFEAITAKRHYRNPMPLPEALRLLKENSGKDFDVNIVDAFVRYYNKNTKYFGTTRNL